MRLPVVSGAEAVKAFRKIGYQFDRRHGSRVVLRRNAPPYRRLSIPNHKELAKGTLRTLIRQCGTANFLAPKPDPARLCTHFGSLLRGL